VRRATAPSSPSAIGEDQSEAQPVGAGGDRSDGGGAENNAGHGHRIGADACPHRRFGEAVEHRIDETSHRGIEHGGVFRAAVAVATTDSRCKAPGERRKTEDWLSRAIRTYTA